MKKEDCTTYRQAILVDSGRDWTRTNDLTDVNPNNWDRVRIVNLPEVESFNN